MSHPAEPGFYWARMRTAFHASPTWQPVQLVRAGHQIAIGERVGPPAAMRWDVLILGDDLVYKPEDVTEWGEPIERDETPALTREQVEALKAAHEGMCGINSVVRGQPVPADDPGLHEDEYRRALEELPADSPERIEADGLAKHVKQHEEFWQERLKRDSEP